jgi:hypothetical protein
METTGFDFDKDEIITIQWQELDRLTGAPIGELNILKRWESSEEGIIKAFHPNLTCYHWDFVFIGKNLLFDFCFLSQRMKHYGFDEFDIRCLQERVWLDIKPILVIMNNGNFIGYDKVLPKTNPLTNDKIPQLFLEEKYPEIIEYIKNEATDFIKAYQTFKGEIPSLTKHFYK